MKTNLKRSGEKKETAEEKESIKLIKGVLFRAAAIIILTGLTIFSGWAGYWIYSDIIMNKADSGAIVPVICANCGKFYEARVTDISGEKCPFCEEIQVAYRQKCSKCGHEFAYVEPAPAENFKKSLKLKDLIVKCPKCGSTLTTPAPGVLNRK